MTDLVPPPAATDKPFCEPTQVTLDVGEQATLTFEPVSQDAMFRVGTVAMSKLAQSEYEVELDGETVYGPAPIPPTDIDDLAMTFYPALGFSQRLRVIVRNLKDTTGGRTYSVQPVGYEVM